jgi:2-methylcitrate dehydratase PrpD
MTNVTGRLCGRLSQSPPILRADAIAKVRQLVRRHRGQVAGAHRGRRASWRHLREQDRSRSRGARFGPAAPVPAALVNAASMDVLDFEPMDAGNPRALAHPGAGALARRLAYRRRCSRHWSKARIRAGSAALGPRRIARLKFHPPGMVGPIGAAAACAHLLRLDASGLANAIGIVTSRCGASPAIPAR